MFGIDLRFRESTPSYDLYLPIAQRITVMTCSQQGSTTSKRPRYLRPQTLYLFYMNTMSFTSVKSNKVTILVGFGFSYGMILVGVRQFSVLCRIVGVAASHSYKNHPIGSG